MLLQELGSYILPIGQVPILLQNIYALFVDDLFQNLLTGVLIFEQSFLLDQLLDYLRWKLVYPSTAPDLWRRVPCPVRTLERPSQRSLLTQIVCDMKCLIVSCDFANCLNLIFVEAGLVTLEREHFSFDFSTIKSLMAFHPLLDME